MATIHHVTINVLEIPPVMLRGHHVLICLRDHQERYILGKKAIYPPGISRFVGGAIEGVEAPPIAAQRELAEETGLDLPHDRLAHLHTIIASITDQHDRSVTFTTYLFAASLTDEEVAQLSATDDVDELAFLTPDDFTQLLKGYQQLPMTIDPNYNFAWGDYGQLYGMIHQLVT